MAKFVINAGRSDQKKVEADSFDLRNDYWYFYDADEKPTYVRVASIVHTIEEQAAS